MIIGVVRHFRVEHHRFTWISCREFKEWIKWYDLAKPTIPNDYKPLVNWDLCYTSPIQRAYKTSEILFANKRIKSNSLAEVPFAAPKLEHIKLPLMLWQVVSRIGWWFGLRFQTESKKQTIERITLFLNEVESSPHQKVLLVTHGFLMQYLRNQLKKRNFSGSLSIHPSFGKLYIFEKTSLNN